MLKNNKGVTLVVLVITIIVLTILTGGVIKTIFSVMYNLRAGRIVANMSLVQAKAETIYEEYQFYNDKSCLKGEKIDSILNLSVNPGKEISNIEINEIARESWC